MKVLLISLMLLIDLERMAQNNEQIASSFGKG